MKRIFTILLGFISLCLMAGCGEEIKNAGTGGSDLRITGPADSLEQSGNSIVFDTGSMDGLKDDAAYELPQLGYEPLKIDINGVLSVFKNEINSGRYKEQKNERTIEGKTYTNTVVTFETKNKSTRLLINNNGLIFDTPYGNAVSTIFQYDDMFINCNADRFEQKDLGFASREQAAKAATEQLAQLGIQAYEKYKIFSLPSNDLNAEQQRLLKEDAAFKDFVDLGKTDLQSEWEDSYFMVFDTHFDGIPMSDEEFNFQSVESGVPATKIEVLVSKSGIKHLYASGFIGKALSENKKKTIDLRSAKSALNKCLDLIIITDTIRVKEAALKYLAIKSELIPAWAFKISQNSTTNWIYINAFTGEQII